MANVVLAVAIVINPSRHVQQWARRVRIAAEAAIFTQDARNFGKEAAMVLHRLVGFSAVKGTVALVRSPGGNVGAHDYVGESTDS